MSNLRLSFSVQLDTYEIPDIVRPNGPLFHRWVPNGRDDAAFLTSSDDVDQLSVWFERRAVNKGNFLEWKQDGTEFDVAIMVRQGKIDGGTLRGEIVLAAISAGELEALAQFPVEPGRPFGQDVTENPSYLALGKRVVRFLQPRVSRFIDTLRNQYGQHWLRQLHPWDSRKESLGSYCSSLSLLWWNEQENKRYRFLPTNLSATMMLQRQPGRGDGEYLTEADWRRLQASRCLEEPSVELTLLGQASRCMDNDELRQAAIEAVTAMELAVSRRLQVENDGPRIQGAIQSFVDNARLPSRVAVALRLCGADQIEIERALMAIEVRNQAVHEGYRVSPSDAEAIRSLIHSTAKLLGLEEIKLPVLYAGNRLSPPGGLHIEIGTSWPMG